MTLEKDFSLEVSSASAQPYDPPRLEPSVPDSHAQPDLLLECPPKIGRI